mgnify:CR=1 FL=1
MNPFFSLRPVTRRPITEVVGEAVNRGVFPPKVLRTTPPDSGYHSPKNADRRGFLEDPYYRAGLKLL